MLDQASRTPGVAAQAPMLRLAPRLETVEAFVAAMRCASFKAAAESLALSPSAFSRRIQALEQTLGGALFDRSGGRPAPTPAGLRYFEEVTVALDRIRWATMNHRAERAAAPLRLIASQSFTLSWLMPRLGAFLQAHGPDGLEVEASRDLALLTAGRADIAIVGDYGQLGGWEVEPFVELEAGLVASGDGPIPDVREDLRGLERCRLIAPTTPPRLWEAWLAGRGYDGPVLAQPKCYDTIMLSYEAVAAGLGVGLAAPLLTDRFFQDGRLRPCLKGASPLGMSYSLVYADPAVRRRPMTRRLVAWLREEAEASRTRFRRTFQ